MCIRDRDGKCPECGRAVTEAAEEAYFFKLSPFADRIEKLLLETDYLQPDRKSTRLNSSHSDRSRMPSSA